MWDRRRTRVRFPCGPLPRPRRSQCAASAVPFPANLSGRDAATCGLGHGGYGQCRRSCCRKSARVTRRHAGSTAWRLWRTPTRSATACETVVALDDRPGVVPITPLTQPMAAVGSTNTVTGRAPAGRRGRRSVAMTPSVSAVRAPADTGRRVDHPVRRCERGVRDEPRASITPYPRTAARVVPEAGRLREGQCPRVTGSCYPARHSTTTVDGAHCRRVRRARWGGAPLGSSHDPPVRGPEHLV